MTKQKQLSVDSEWFEQIPSRLEVHRNDGQWIHFNGKDYFFTPENVAVAVRKPRILPSLKETLWLVFIGACCGALVGWLLVAWMMYDPNL